MQRTFPNRTSARRAVNRTVGLEARLPVAPTGYSVGVTDDDDPKAVPDLLPDLPDAGTTVVGTQTSEGLPMRPPTAT